jgi:hypothetical protein
MVKKFFSVVTLLLAVTHINAMTSADVSCPKSIGDSADSGWRVVNIESDFLRRKPNLRRKIPQSHATIAVNDGRTDFDGPSTVMHDAIRLPDNRVIRAYDIRGEDGKIYPGNVLACFYAGDSHKFLVKPPPAGSIKCNTFVDAAGNDEMRFVCTSTQ